VSAPAQCRENPCPSANALATTSNASSRSSALSLLSAVIRIGMVSATAPMLLRTDPPNKDSGAFEFFDAFLKPCNEFAKLLIFAEQLFVGRSVHADLASDHHVNCVELIAIFTLAGKTTLNNHRERLAMAR
jgi:hypothetical protein